MKCPNCKTRANFSIHGNCLNCGKNTGMAYNGQPKVDLEPITKRGKRRRANKRANKES